MSIPEVYDLQPRNVKGDTPADRFEVTADMVRQAARLALLEVGEAELAGLRRDMEQVLGFVAAMDRVHLEAGEAGEAGGAEATPLRDDVAAAGMHPDVVLARAPAVRQRFISVPRVLPAREDRR